jgi:hypothetical protein
MTKKYSLLILAILILPLYACVSLEEAVSKERQVPGSVPTAEELAALRSVRFPSQDASGPREIVTQDNLVDEQRYLGYTVRIYKDKLLGIEGYLEISKDSEILFTQQGGVFRVGLANPDIPDDALVKMGSDINRDGTPDLVVSERTAGPNSDFIFYIFSLGREFKLWDKLDAGPDELARFKDIDRDGEIEFYVHDLAFDYWHSNLSDSPKPMVVYEYSDGKYALDMEGMRKRAPDSDGIQEKIDAINARIEYILSGRKEKGKQDEIDEVYYSAWIKGDTIIPSETWSYMLELIYGGHYKLAWEFLDQAWPKDKPGKEEFILECKLQLAKSRYWEEIAKRI